MSIPKLETFIEQGFTFPKEVLTLGQGFMMESQSYGYGDSGIEKDVSIEFGNEYIDLDRETAQAMADFLLKHLNITGNE